jgi:hypothetical protein
LIVVNGPIIPILYPNEIPLNQASPLVLELHAFEHILLAVIGILVLFVTLVPFRRKERWSWFALFSAWAVFFSGILPTVASYDSSSLFSYTIFAVVWLSSLLVAVPSVLLERGGD